ncbi:prepilin peptidase [Faecalispora sporosphaeroides]|uniref:prepilin peptidase n=1 Tax=Faecalispora sporosphaeroides TaxID=1549 RepID=UPI0015A719F8|nr:prepilin peptidase [Faecalispora sporosphaeroides]
MLFKGVLFTISLLIISFTDFKLQIIPNILLIPVICSGFIGVTWNSVAGLLFPSALFLMMAYFKNGIGGGDIKLMSACGFALGIYGAILAALIGLLLFLIVHLPTYLKHKNKVYALAPCLSVGCFVVFNMIGG